MGDAADHAIAAVGVFVLWAVAEGATHVLRLYQPGRAQRRRAALGWLQFTLAATLIVGYGDAFLVRWTTWVPSGVAWVGVAVAVLGIAIRVVARVQLGRNFSAYVQTCSDHRLVTAGLYSVVRHPAYSGFVLMLLGFPIAFGSVASLAVALLIGAPALVVRINAEEAALAGWFGDDYRRYQQRTARLAPGVW